MLTLKAPPLVTVAVPTLRRPQTLRQTLITLRAQTWPALEIIVSDNGSGDNTPDVVAEVADERFRFRRNETTVPIQYHFNQLIMEARGEFFVLVSDDDLVSPGFVEALVTALAADRSIRAALPRFEIIDVDGRVTEALPVPDWRIIEGREFLLDWLLSRAASPVATFVTICARTEDLRAVGGNPDFVDAANADNACFMALAMRGFVAFAPDAVLQYRVYPSSRGLSIPPERLALSAKQFRAYLAQSPVMAEGLANFDEPTQHALRRGVSRMVAAQFLGRLGSLYLRRSGYRAVLKAVFAYEADLEYVRALPRFLARLILQAVRDLCRARPWRTGVPS